MATKDKFEQLKAIVNKQFGSKVIQTFDEEDDTSIERFSSGILSLDMVLGKGTNGYGWPVGRVCELFGGEGNGKSSIVLATVAEMTKRKEIVAYIDAEHSLNIDYAKRMGVDTDYLYVVNPDNAEQGYDVAETLAKSGDVRLIVIDSIAAMVPMNIMDASFEDKHMDTGAKLNTAFMRVMAGILSQNRCTLLLVNQLREKVGVSYGNPEYTPGGRAIKFYSSIRIDVRRSEVVKADDGTEIGHVIKVKTVKNKVARPQQTTDFKLIWGEGFDKSHCIINQGLIQGVIKKGGAWFTVGDDKFQGRDALTKRLVEDEEFYTSLKEQVLGGIDG